MKAERPRERAWAWRAVRAAAPPGDGPEDFAGERDEAVDPPAPAAVQRRRRPWADLLQRALLLFVLGSAPLLFGAVQAWVWPVYAVAMYAAFVLLLWSGSGAGRSGEGAGWTAAVGVFLAFSLLACVPLPPGLLAWLSPGRFELLNRVQELAGAAPAAWTVSYAPSLSLAWWSLLLGLALLYRVMAAHFAEPRFMQALLWVLFGLAAFEAVYGILQALIPNLGVLWVGYLKSGMGSARGTYINRNHFAGFMEMLLPLLLGFGLARVKWHGEPRVGALLNSERLHQHLLVILGLALMALALLFSQSRGGITGAFLALAVFALLVRGRGRRLPLGVRAALAGFLGLTLLYGLRIGFGPILERFLALEQGDSRLAIWRDSLALIADHPLGIGLAAFDTVFPLYHVSASTDAVTPVYMHNDVLQLLAEAGWVGLLCLGGAYAAFMAMHFARIRRMRPADDPRRFFLAAGAFSGLAALGLHSLMDFNLQIPANAAYFVMLLAVVRVMTRPGSAPPREGEV